MATERYNRPRVSRLLLGLLAAVLVLAALWNLTELVKTLGSVLLFIPSQVGLVDQATSDDVLAYRPIEGRTTIELPAAGRYAVYADHKFLLRSNEYAITVNRPWLGVRRLDIDGPIEVAFTDRGVRPWDTIAADGRPLLYFDIEEPGPYEFSDSGDGSSMNISIVPYFSTENESAKETILILTVAGILLLLAIIYLRAVKQRRHSQLHQRKGADQIVEMNR